MAHPVATLFALSMAIWVADVRLAPAIAPEAPAVSAAVSAADVCRSGPSATADADLEIVVCGSRVP